MARRKNELAPEKLSYSCNPTQFNFKSTLRRHDKRTIYDSTINQFDNDDFDVNAEVTENAKNYISLLCAALRSLHLCVKKSD